MKREPVLVVMAAGMGSRYGGLKQIDPVGSRGEAILDYSLYDAYEAGFRTAVIIIKKAIEADFMEVVDSRLKKCPMEIRYAYQELENIPDGFQIPSNRTKPWGTSHALLCAREQIGDAPFAVVNADDYYGKSAYRTIFDFLSKAGDSSKQDYCMVGYLLKNTVTDHGSVARAICCADKEDNLTAIVERTRIEKYGMGIHFTTDDGKTWTDLDPDTTVSMNMWGFVPGFLEEVQNRLPEFLKDAICNNPEKAEFLLPTTVGQLLSDGIATVKVLRSADTWHGVTYAKDKPVVVDAIRRYTEQGLYPDGLWN